MMVRCVSVSLILLAGLAYASPAEAQAVQDFWHSVIRDAKRNNCWPEAFLPADRLAVRAPFALMVRNGWRRQNMLADHHFQVGGNTLNEAGELKVRWIMTEAPRHHRDIYVHRAPTPEATVARIEAVQEVALQFAGEGQLPNVLETSLDAAGWPATRVDMIDKRWVESAPDPRLPETGSSSDDSQ
ncbi:MAG: hypothetical protein ABIP48_01545 [Planctomycetota bacterium]